MHERIIDELMKQSRTEYWTQYTPSYDYEKFTELLIKEAIKTVQSVGDKASNDIPFEVTDLFVSQLRQRFGVQE